MAKFTAGELKVMQLLWEHGEMKPADMLDTPTGVETVAKLLGAIESGVSL